MTQPGATLKELVMHSRPDAAEVAAHLDGLSLPDRIAAVRSLQGTRLQGALWNAASGHPRLTTEDLVPSDYPALRPVIFHGKNSLPVFSEFQTICFRPEPDAKVAWGYNETTIRNWIGAGWYVLHDTPEAGLGGAAFDYTQLPTAKLPSWPEIRPNEAGISRFVYANMVDYMRRVSADVFIGSAVRGGKEMGSYFVVARELLAN